MSDPKGGSNMEKYLKEKASLEANIKKYEETKNKETKTAQKLHDKILYQTVTVEWLEKHKDDVVLSKTCISHLEDWIKENYFGRRKQLDTDAIQKGIECENEAIFVLNKATWKEYKKSVYKDGEMMQNEWITWHEDIDVQDHTIDVKVCQTFDTFPILDDEVSGSYWRQWQAYMRLKGEWYKQHFVTKVLVNTPERQLTDKLERLYFQLSKKYPNHPDILDAEYSHQARQIFLQNVFDNQLSILANGESFCLKDSEVISYEQRINAQIVYRDNKAIEKIKKRVEECRLYLHQKWYKQF